LFSYSESYCGRFAPEYSAYHNAAANILIEAVLRSTGPILDEVQHKAALDVILGNACREKNWSGLRATMLLMTQFLSKFNPGMPIVGFKPKLPAANETRGEYGANETAPAKEVVWSDGDVSRLIYFSIFFYFTDSFFFLFFFFF
jgi:hypothetical protein